MATLDEVKAQLQVLSDALNTLEAAPAPVTETEVDVVKSDGTEEKFAPEA